MKATVVQIESGSKYIDKERRIELKFEGADSMFGCVRFPENMLGPFAGGLKLDDVLDVSIVTEREMGEFKRQLADDLKHEFNKVTQRCSCGWVTDHTSYDHWEVQWARHKRMATAESKQEGCAP